jgi:hypothetical protein
MENHDFYIKVQNNNAVGVSEKIQSEFFKNDEGTN